MAQKKNTCFFTFTDIEKRVNKRLDKETGEDETKPNAVFKKHLWVILFYYMKAMTALESLKKREDIDIRKIERIEKDIKSMYYLFAMAMEHVVNEHRTNLKDIIDVGKKQK